MRVPVLVILALSGCAADPCDDPLSAPITLTFEPGELDVTAREILRVANACKDDVTVSSATVSGDTQFVVEDVAASLPGEGEGLFSVAFTPVDYLPRVAQLDVETSHGTQTIVLLGRADPDQDGDGFLAIQAGGDDCDDADDGVGPAKEEEYNGADDDCDGLVDEGFVKPGDVLITELMLSPKAVTPEVGQWVEFKNVSSNTKDLTGWVLAGTAGKLTLPPGIRLRAGETAVIGFEADTSINGGVELDGVFEGDTEPLPSQGFHLTLSLEGLPIAVLVGYRWPEESGSSIALDGLYVDQLQASSPDVWCASSTELASGDRGTPNAANDPCPQFDHDGDGISPNDGDCDDTDGDISPDAPEVWDGIDQNCDGLVDQLQIGVATGGHLRGGQQLGSSVAVGDWDGDDKQDVLVLTGGNNSSRVYRVDPASFIAAAVAIDDVGQGSIGISGNGRATGMEAPVDVDGDGDLDVLIYGRSPNFYQGGSTRWPYAWVFDGLPGSGDDWAQGDAIIAIDDPLDGVGGSSTRGLFGLDLDGDGTDDTVLGNGSYKGDTSFPGTYRGRVWIVDLEEASGTVDLDEVAWSVWTGATEGTAAGEVLAGGDVDDDGYDDVLITDMTAPSESTRRVQLIPGAAELAEVPSYEELASVTITGLVAPGQQAEDVGAPLLQDIDGDEKLDLAVPDPWGKGVLIYWDAATLTGEVAADDADLVIDGPAAFGLQLSWGDLRGDGTPDLLVGAPAIGFSGPGHAFLYGQGVLNGSGELDETDSAASFRSDRSSDLGTIVHLVDLDLDGADEVLLGDRSDGNVGALFVFRPE